jgi:uncharacterized lipoprotein YajG
MEEPPYRQTLKVLAACALLAGCKAPTVNLATSDPIKVDINMRLDVYQYSTTATKSGGSNPGRRADARIATAKSNGGHPAIQERATRGRGP